MSKETLSTVFVSDQRSPEKWALPPPPSLEGGDSDTNLSATSNDDGESNYVNDAHDFVLSGSHAISGSELNLTSSDEDSAYNKDGIEDGYETNDSGDFDDPYKNNYNSDRAVNDSVGRNWELPKAASMPEVLEDRKAFTTDQAAFVASTQEPYSALLMDSVLISRTLASDTLRAPELVGGGFLDEAPPPPPDSSDSDDSDEDGEYVDVGFETA